MKPVPVIRMIVMVVVLYLVYLETGAATVLALFLIGSAIEISAILHKKHSDAIAELKQAELKRKLGF